MIKNGKWQCTSGGSVLGGLDVAWKYARPIEDNKHDLIHIRVKKCKEVPPDIKKEVITWIKDKESSKQHKKSVEENIRSTARGGYMGNKSSNPVNDDDDDDDDEDGYADPPYVHLAEKEDYLAAIRALKQEEWFRQ
ncbi:unnamed protein product [Prunus armeniaca]|uniref:Uncharacterized protein n=1 Tax=Prunus armeniaca TaxID=36596 RepID=A0A6J5URM4_PRUAR|nr:unnamed protein product [Prunus armeniaca]